MKLKLCVLEDQKLMRKFCHAMDRHYGCKSAFGTSVDSFGSCKACPLATAVEVGYLMNLKGLQLGEAVKATLRGPISAQEAYEILQSYARQPRPYPDPEGE